MAKPKDDEHDGPVEDQSVEDMALETLSGDLRDAMLMRVRDMQKPWPAMTEAEQRDSANGLEMAAKHLIRGVVRLLTDYEFPRCVVTLGEVKIKGEKGIEAKITAPNHEDYRTKLGEHVGDMVTMVMIDSTEFMGEREPAKVDKDQPELDMEGKEAPETEAA